MTISVLVVAICLIIQKIQWTGAEDFHSVMISFTITILLITGILAVLLYKSNESKILLLIAIVFLGTFLFEMFFFLKPGANSADASWSWFTSRLYFSLFFIGLVLFRNDSAFKIFKQKIPLMGGITLSLVWTNIFIHRFSYPQFPDFLIHQPLELISAALFFIAFIIISKKGLQSNVVEQNVEILILFGFLSQLFMSFSSQLFDISFHAAHIFRNLSYIVVTGALLFSIYERLQQASKSVQNLSWASEEVELQMEERRWTEELLQETRIYAESIIATIRESLLVLDSEMRVIKANRSFFETFKVTAEETLNHFLFELGDGQWNNEELLDTLKKIIPEGATLDGFELTQSFQKIGRRTLLLNAQRIYQGVVSTNLILLVMQDITEQKQSEQELHRRAEELARSNEELEQFAYIASHDLQEPLRMVSSYCQLLQRRYQEQLDADANEFIEYAVDGAKRMRELINDLLAYSRVGTHASPLELTDCNEALALALENLKIVIEENDVKIVTSQLPKTEADKTQLVQLFQNLIGNAIKFKNGQIPEIEVRSEKKNGEWVFSVKDNGIGIDQEYASRIFVIFQRLHTRSEYAGNGIGLSICKKIVERHGGRIWVNSEHGQGSTFYFTLPRNGDQKYETKLQS